MDKLIKMKFTSEYVEKVKMELSEFPNDLYDIYLQRPFDFLSNVYYCCLSRRTIAIGDTLIKALINYKNRQDYLKEIFGTQYKYYHLEDDNVDKRIVINNNNEVKIQLLEARYVDTSNISLVNSRVGDSLTKVFYVKNITDNDLYYNINLVDVANSFVNKEELVFFFKV